MSKQVYKYGTNDMPYGWTKKNEQNKRAYELWRQMLRRCYSEKFQERSPTYKGCYVCERWLILSNFISDIAKIDNYELWLNNPNKRISLDKDIKSNGKNKCYRLEECMFVYNEVNTKQAVSTRNNDYLIGNNNPMNRIKRNEIKNIIPCVAINNKTKEIYEEDSVVLLCEKLEKITGKVFDNSSVSKVCKYNHDKEEYVKTHKTIVKSVKGFTFYYKEDFFKE